MVPIDMKDDGVQSQAVPKFKDKFSIFHIYRSQVKGRGYIQKGMLLMGILIL